MKRSWASSEAARRTMQANRRRDTSPELAVRKLLHAAGLRYRVDYRVVPELRARADLAFTRARIAVFVDGCFWHSCPEHGTRPKSNADYWIPKLARNVQRDRATDAALESLGWLVLRFWEHEDAVSAADRIADAVRGRRH
ncbi:MULTISPECIES: very short patch repair endonuclease [unclassified Microbacterium]|uniref:very short patch repair endonuclease n=1 Tax=unclassified Microbacterium TaxID=2609290 RepID=UPI0024692F08|nr:MULTISPECIES: very short patch repair endonuclease [unclassified Microbacterium]MDH5131841.1 very short patch repair endonuclease [Microbacterium sp. RD10]MDH5135646.1 very short patch repair endonuclease [Microbacterium sp. RD11]MDH5145220.1 very short patch repair endonuclease [Microbacterium sp. RD12]MDH5153639.1 very short patch repair endonuclease [Microbacterium sp. RD06]MDH5166245.1 very short patch repair endonuclease [Microbacterium sp. RD02]